MLGELTQTLSIYSIPAILLLIPLVGAFRGIKVYETFIEGATEGFQTAIKIIPCLVAMLMAIRIFRDSGAMQLCIDFLNPILAFLDISPELVPLALMRPLSGGASLGIVTELLHTHGPDSLIGKISSTLIASTDTTFYVLTVYFGAIGIRNARYAASVGLLGDAMAFFASIYICTYIFCS